MPTPKPEKIKCPFTGKMIPKPPPRPVATLPDDDNPLTGAAGKRLSDLEKEMADIRTKYAALEPGKRTGSTGDRLASKYRRLSLEYWNLTGKHPPKVYDEL